MTMTEKLAAFATATQNELFDAEYGWMTEAVETRETIEDFLEASHSYNECTREKFGEIAGMKFVAFSKVQPRKGDQRRALSVIDFGDLRIAIDADLTDFRWRSARRCRPEVLMKALLALLFLCAACGGSDTSDHLTPIADLTPAEAAAIGRGCQDLDRDGFCDVEIQLTVTWPEGWQ